MKNSIRVNVRTLAEFYTEGGDLFYTGGAMERMREGVRGHQAIQSAYGEEWEKEVSLSMDVEAEGLMLRLYGRADGLCRTSVPPVIEEIKTTNAASTKSAWTTFPPTGCRPCCTGPCSAKERALNPSPCA